jgi:hypothetical protein
MSNLIDQDLALGPPAVHSQISFACVHRLGIALCGVPASVPSKFAEYCILLHAIWVAVKLVR